MAEEGEAGLDSYGAVIVSQNVTNGGELEPLFWRGAVFTVYRRERRNCFCRKARRDYPVNAVMKAEMPDRAIRLKLQLP